MDKESFCGLKISITLLSLIGAVAIKFNSNCSNQETDFILSSLVYDLAIAIFSAMILVWFIDEIGNHIQERHSQKKKKLQSNALIRFCNFTSINMFFYFTVLLHL